MENVSKNADWMSKLDDALALGELSIPATHDSGATISLMGLWGQCQKTTIKEQLDMGVRLLDIRLRLVDNELNVVHDIVDQDLTFSSVLEDVTAFIANHPSEFIIVSIKEDDEPKNSTVAFNEKVEQMLKEHSSISHDQSFPKTVGDARGRIFILARYVNSSMGVPANPGWADSQSFEISGLYVQDNYRITDIETKKKDFNKALDIAKEKKYTLVLNFASCYLENALPHASASKTAKEINPYLCKTLKDTHAPLGVILCDFITKNICDIIIDSNF